MSTEHSIAYKWASAWSVPGPNPDPAAWLALYNPQAKYIDHAFLLVRIGQDTLRLHFNIWRTCMPDFVMQIEEECPPQSLSDGRTKYSVRTTNAGTFVHDLPRRKASGQRFWFRGVVDLTVSAEGLIDEVEEWYCPDFDGCSGLVDYDLKQDG